MLRLSNLQGFSNRDRRWKSYNELTNTVATWNPSDKGSNITLSGSNLIAQGTAVLSTHHVVRATAGLNQGKAYWEITVAGATTTMICLIGLCDSAKALSGTGLDSSSPPGAMGFASNAGAFYGTSSGSAVPLANGTYGIAYDLDATVMFIRNSGGWLNSSNPTTGVLPSWTAVAPRPPLIMPAVSIYNDNAASFTANFGASAFAYAVP